MSFAEGGPYLDVIDEHFDELTNLWKQWLGMQQSPQVRLQHLYSVEQRMQAHLDGLLSQGPSMVPFLQMGLTSEDPNDVFVAAYTFLKYDAQAGAAAVCEAFESAQPAAISGFVLALSHGPASAAREKLLKLLDTGNAITAVATAQILAFHQWLPYAHPRLEELRHDEDTAIRVAAWKATAMIDPP